MPFASSGRVPSPNYVRLLMHNFSRVLALAQIDFESVFMLNPTLSNKHGGSAANQSICPPSKKVIATTVIVHVVCDAAEFLLKIASSCRVACARERESATLSLIRRDAPVSVGCGRRIGFDVISGGGTYVRV